MRLLYAAHKRSMQPQTHPADEFKALLDAKGIQQVGQPHVLRHADLLSAGGAVARAAGSGACRWAAGHRPLIGKLLNLLRGQVGIPVVQVKGQVGITQAVQCLKQHEKVLLKVGKVGSLGTALKRQHVLASNEVQWSEMGRSEGVI